MFVAVRLSACVGVVFSPQDLAHTETVLINDGWLSHVTKARL